MHLLHINCFLRQGFGLLGFAEVDVDEVPENTQDPGLEKALYDCSDDVTVKKSELEASLELVPPDISSLMAP